MKHVKGLHIALTTPVSRLPCMICFTDLAATLSSGNAAALSTRDAHDVGSAEAAGGRVNRRWHH